MKLVDKFERHTNLFQRMSEARQVDLGDALIAGLIDGQDLRSSVLRCMQCEQTEQCEHWLDDSGPGANPRPTECRNKPLLDRLSARA